MYEEFRTGSIISLRLYNFQTYSDAEFFFHPKLNFIAGPNGSGKSTIANSIAFIFGGTTKMLCKSKDLVDFIKFNAADSFIEAKIKNGNDVITVKRTIVRFKNSSLWFVNNRAATFAQVQQIYTDLKININNICNYLPQERVSEFTKFTPESMFKMFVETYHEQDIINNINFLVDFESSYDELVSNSEKIACNKKSIENVINNMSKDLKKIKEKELAEQKIELMKSKKKWLLYELERKEYICLKTQISNQKAEIERIRSEITELDAKISSTSNNKSMKKHNEQVAEIKQSNAALDEYIKHIENFMHEKEKILVDLKRNEKNKDRVSEKIEMLKIEKLNTIEKLEKLQTPKKPKPVATDNFDKAEQEMMKLQKDLTNLNKESAAMCNEIENLTKQKNLIVDIELRRLEILKNYHNDTYKAVMWLRNHKNMFKDEIIEPCILSLSLKNSNYVKEVEGCLSYQALTSFICRNSQDFELLMKTLKDKNKLSINAVEYNSSYKDTCPYPREHIKKMGFDGYLVDYIDDREEVLIFLSSMFNFSSIPVAKKELDELMLFKKHNFVAMIINSRYLAIKRSR